MSLFAVPGVRSGKFDKTAMFHLLKRFVLMSFLMSMGVAYGQVASRPTGNFDIIVGISAHNGETTAKEIRFLLKDSSSLVFRGYCQNQECIILTAEKASFDTPQQVVEQLRAIYGDLILGYKDYAVAEFYSKCSFPEETEYQYFKATYGK